MQRLNSLRQFGRSLDKAVIDPNQLGQKRLAKMAAIEKVEAMMRCIKNADGKKVVIYRDDDTGLYEAYDLIVPKPAIFIRKRDVFDRTGQRYVSVPTEESKVYDEYRRVYVINYTGLIFADVHVDRRQKKTAPTIMEVAKTSWQSERFFRLTSRPYFIVTEAQRTVDRSVHVNKRTPSRRELVAAGFVT